MGAKAIGLWMALVATGCATAQGGREASGSEAQLEALRADRSAKGQEALAQLLYRGLADGSLRPERLGTSRDALYTEGLRAAIAAAEASGDPASFVALVYWQRLPGPFDAAAAAAAACQASAAKPAAPLLAEECGDFLAIGGDARAAVPHWRQAIAEATRQPDILRLIVDILRVSIDPLRDLAGIPEELVRRARDSEERDRRYGYCLATCEARQDSCLVSPLRNFARRLGSPSGCAVAYAACAGACGSYQG